MKFQPEILVFLGHLILACIYTIFILIGWSRLRKQHIFVLIFMPIFGLLAALTIELMIYWNRQGTSSLDLEQATLDDDILWTTLRRFHEKGDLVPLEEAVLIDEVQVRRKSMLETLYGDPLKYLGVLNVAKHNEDIEISHYATTTISKAQKDFQLAVQKYALEIERHPDDPEVLDAYLEILRQYIQSGLLEAKLLSNLRMVYSKMLNRKLSIIRNDRDTLIEKLRNAIELNDFTCALETSNLLKRYWPEDEQTWIEVVRVYVEGKDGEQLKRTLEEIQHRPIFWTEQGREQIGPWLKLVTP